ncbi:MAG: hypothetical protein ACJAR2_000772 [Ilumatobacter sp.]
MTWIKRSAVVVALSYLVALGWAMQRLEYDLWGALVIGPVLAAVSVPLINQAFRGSLAPLRPLAWMGLACKLGGAVSGYFIRSGAYGGFADANQYHQAGARLAAGVRSGDSTVMAVIPFEPGTLFIEDVTAMVYTIFGSSKLGGYFVFAWLSYWGLVLTLIAGIIAVPLLARKRYAVLLFTTPSLVYWGSSIGKEAVVGFFLGMIAVGIALAFNNSDRQQMGFAVAAVGAAGTAMVRPHFAAVWVGAAGIAVAIRLVHNLFLSSRAEHNGSRIGALLMLGLACGGFLIVSTLTLSYLDPNEMAVNDESVAVTDRISQIFEATEGRTSTGNSTLELVSTGSPVNYPYAAFRTLTRPLIIEAGSLTELLPAAEITVLLVLAALSWRRFANLPRLLFGNPYIVFALVCVVTFGVAFASVGNLGILVRQRSLVFPLLLLFWCIPARVPQTLRAMSPPSALHSQPASTN